MHAADALLHDVEDRLKTLQKSFKIPTERMERTLQVDAWTQARLGTCVTNVCVL